MSELLAKVNEVAETIGKMKSSLETRVGELERRAAREPANDNYISRSEKGLGDFVVASDEFKKLTPDFRGKATIRLFDEKATITSGSGTVGASTSGATSLVPSDRRPGIVDPFSRQLFLRDLIPSTPIASNLVEYGVEAGFTNNARPVTETTTKPTSDLTFELKQAPVRTLAHIFKVSRQILDDAPGLASYINKRGTYGLKTVEETQLLTGNGTGQNLNGIIPQAVDYETARNSTGDDELQVLLHAISQAEEADAPVTGIVLSKKKWRDILGIRDNEGRYLSSGPFASTAPKIWDLPVVASNAIADDDFLVGSFGSGVGAEIFDRMAVEVLLSSENSDDFEKNMLTVRIEERLTLAVYRPEAFVYGSF